MPNRAAVQPYSSTRVMQRKCRRKRRARAVQRVLYFLAALLVAGAVGLVLLLNRDVSMVFMVLVLGLWALASAGFRLYTLAQLRRAGLPWGSVALDAGLKLLLAVFMLVRPVKTMALWAQLVGVFFLIIGVSVIVSALYFDRAFHDRDDF